jgi:hypothetical protein
LSNASELQPARIGDDSLALDQWTYIEVDNRRTRHDRKKRRGGGWFGLAMGDLNGDGYRDIASGEWIYLNPGGDMTGQWRRVTVRENTDNLEIVDVDRDAQADLIAVRCNEQFWLENRSPPGSNSSNSNSSNTDSWNSTRVSTLPICNHKTSSQGYGLAQLRPGGLPEILLSDEGIYALEIPTRPDSKPWSAIAIATSGSNGEEVVGSDINGDGNLDVVGGTIAEGDGNGVAWWEHPGQPSENWQRHPVGTTVYHEDRLAAADLNGDGLTDIVVTEEWSRSDEPITSLYWFEQIRDGDRIDWQRHKIATQSSLNSLDVADIDRDGDIDLVTGEHKGANRLQLWENSGTGTFVGHPIDNGKESHLGAQFADMDGDGDLDILSIAWDDFQYLHLWRNDAIVK